MSTEVLEIAGLPVEVVRKPIKNMHFGVYPPNGHVRVSVPQAMPVEAVSAAVISRLPWLRRAQRRLQDAPRQTPRDMVAGESHYLGGRRYRLKVGERVRRTELVVKSPSTLVLYTKPNSSLAVRLAALEQLHRTYLADLVPDLMAVWSDRLSTGAVEWKVRRMKTRWGTANAARRSITLNSELATQTPACLEYVVVHELIHMSVPGHGDEFKALMTECLPDWKARKAILDQTTLVWRD